MSNGCIVNDCIVNSCMVTDGFAESQGSAADEISEWMSVHVLL